MPISKDWTPTERLHLIALLAGVGGLDTEGYAADLNGLHYLFVALFIIAYGSVDDCEQHRPFIETVSRAALGLGIEKVMKGNVC